MFVSNSLSGSRGLSLTIDPSGKGAFTLSEAIGLNKLRERCRRHSPGPDSH